MGEIEMGMANPVGITLKDAKPLLGSRPNIYRLLKRGEIESYQIGRSRFLVVASIDAYIARQIEKSRVEMAAKRAQDLKERGPEKSIAPMLLSTPAEAEM